MYSKACTLDASTKMNRQKIVKSSITTINSQEIEDVKFDIKETKHLREEQKCRFIRMCLNLNAYQFKIHGSSYRSATPTP